MSLFSLANRCMNKEYWFFQIFLALFILAVSENALGGYEKIPLLPSGGAKWDFIFDTHLAHHPEKNRFYTVASATDGKRLLHFDSITGAVIASMTTTAQPDWSPIDIEVWKNGNEVLVAWGKAEGSERSRGTGLELGRADVNTGYTKGASQTVRFISFDIDQDRDIAWGITAPTNETQYAITSLDLNNGSVNNILINLAIEENIIRDVILDASGSMLYTLIQPAQPGNPNIVQHYGILLAHHLPFGQEVNRLEIPPEGNYRPGGLTLDQSQGLIYILPFDGGSLHQINAKTLSITNSWTEDEIAPWYQALGAIDVQDNTGRLFLASDAETKSASRVVLFDPVESRVVRAWTSGADPTAVIYDARLDRAYTASSRANIATVLEASNAINVSSIPLALGPSTIIMDINSDRLFMFTKAYQLLSISLNNTIISDFVQLDNYSESIGAVLDELRARLIAGVNAVTPPVIMDLNTLSVIGSLEKAGTTLAISPSAGLIFQTGGTPFSSVAPLYISDATTGKIYKEIPASALFAQTKELAVDETRNILYGLRLSPVKLWAYDWVSGASVIINVDSGSASALSVDEQSGRIIAVTGGNKIYIYNDINDPTPVMHQLQSMSVISDVFVEPGDGLAVVTGYDFSTMKIFIGWMGLDGNPSYQQVNLDIQNQTDFRMTMDPDRNSLWLATELPSALHRIPWPWLNSAPKPVMNKIINMTAHAMPGYNHILWEKLLEPPATVAYRIYRKEGPLSEYRSLLPAMLPGTATDYIDPDVIPGQRYYYRLEWIDSTGVSTSSGIVSVIADKIGIQDVRIRPLNWLARIPAGSSAEMTLLFQGEHQSSNVVSIQIGETSWIDRRNVSINIIPQQVSVPGAAHLVIQAATDSPLGMNAIPVTLQHSNNVGTLWLFYDIFQPLDQESNIAKLYPYGESTVSLQTDSRLRENDENLLVLKGRIGLPQSENRGSGIIARYQIDDATINEQRGILASNGQYSFSIRLPALTPDTIVRAQVTWMGTNTQPGGVSPVIQLPVGGYSAQANAKPGEVVEDPEPAFFIRGSTPENASDEDIYNIVNHATEVLLGEFVAAREVLSSTREVDDRMKGIHKARTVLFYVIGETVGGSVRLKDGSLLSPHQIRKWIEQLNPETNPIIILEGLHDEQMLNALQGLRGTVIASSSITDQINIFKPWDASFTSWFVDSCKKWILSTAFEKAQLVMQFVDQHPVAKLDEKSGELNIAGRYVPVTLPDLFPPRFKTFPVSGHHFAGEPYDIAIRIQDDGARNESLKVEIQILQNENHLGSPIILNSSNSIDGYFYGCIESPPWPDFTLVAVASDSSGNRSDPVSIHITTRAELSEMDLNQDGKMDAIDLFLWSSDPEKQYEGWKFDAMDSWH